MTNEEILKLQKRARYVATKRGHPGLADDFAQDLILAFIENPNRHSTVEQIFIDYLRGTYGNTRTAIGRLRSHAERTWVSFDAPGDEGKEQSPLSDRLAAIEPNSSTELARRESGFLFTGRKAEIYDAYFVREESGRSIAEALELTECRISQILTGMKKEITEYYQTRDALERMEWDPNYGKLEVDWITL